MCRCDKQLLDDGGHPPSCTTARRRWCRKAFPCPACSETGLFDKLIKMKYDIPNDQLEMFDEYMKEIDDTINSCCSVRDAADAGAE